MNRALLLCLCLASCGGSSRAIITDAALSGICEPHIALCEETHHAGTCGAATTCVNVRERAETEHQARLAAEATANVDQQEAQYKISSAESERDRAKIQRWWWGGTGLALGIVLSAVVAVAAAN